MVSTNEERTNEVSPQLPQITDAQRKQLDRDGYFLLEDVFTPSEMDKIAERIESFQQRHAENLRAAGGTQNISRADEITFTDHLAEQDEVLREFCKRPEFVAITTQLLGPDIDLYWNQSVFKMPETAKEFPWHQDDGYTPVEPSPYLTLWLALNDATPENGCISVLPGSHKNGLVKHRDSPIGLVCHAADDPDQGVRVPVRAGSVAVFWSLTFHKSGPNTSNGPRKAYVIQYSKSPLKAVGSDEPFDLIPVARGGNAVA
jgi:ectoine hydroxylase-related dioxygenase (phytanoyl-CoA dioxygenase family)